MKQVKPEVEKAPVVEGTEEAIKILSKASAKVFTRGGNSVYTFLKHARSYVRKAAGIPGRAGKPKVSAEDLNAGLAAILAD